MKKEPLLSKDVPSRALKAVKQLRAACTHTVTREELDLDEFGAALRKLRKDADITLRGMARHLGVSAPFVADCELGNRKLSLSHTIRFIELCL